MIFPPSFFNIMMHLLVYLVKEIGIIGHIFLHNMFPFEQYFAVIKKYVRNRARPEESIAKGYVTKEVIEFCVDYVEELCPIGIPVSRHEGDNWKGHTWKKISKCHRSCHVEQNTSHSSITIKAWWLHTWRSTCKLCETYTL